MPLSSLQDGLGIPEHFQIVDHAPEWHVKNGFLPISARPGLGIELVGKAGEAVLMGPLQGLECVT